jgi:hypothetical protein
MKMMSRLIGSAACVVSLGGFAGCAADHPHEHVRRERVVVVDEPPRPRVERIPVAPSRDHVWVEGHWVRRGHGWEWEPGYYLVRPRPPVAWVPGHWER